MNLTSHQQDVVQRIAEVQRQVAAACSRSDRTPAGVRLLMVTKEVPLPLVEAALGAGQFFFAENYVQAAIERLTSLRERDPRVSLHMIGPLQRNKAKDAVGFFDCIQTVDSLKLVDELEKQADRKSICQQVLLQVNVAADEGKSGCAPKEAVSLVKRMQSTRRLNLAGLMTIGKFGLVGEARRDEFRKLRKLRDALEQDCGMQLPELSMGMSGDFVEAIEEGATIVRIGTAIFGER